MGLAERKFSVIERVGPGTTYGEVTECDREEPMKTRFVHMISAVAFAAFSLACGEVERAPADPDATVAIADAQSSDDAVSSSPDATIISTVDASTPPPDAFSPPDADTTPDATVVPPCTVANDCRIVSGKRIYRVPMNIGTSGNAICAANNLTCVSAPVLSPVAAACTAFHPGVPVTSSTSGWREAVFCNGTPGGLACSNQVKCHHCPACTAGNLSCGTGSSSNLSEVYVECQ